MSKKVRSYVSEKVSTRICELASASVSPSVCKISSLQAIFELGYFKERPDAFYRLATELWPDNFAPTPTHHFIALLSEKGLLRRVFTQNIDSLEAIAGAADDI